MVISIFKYLSSYYGINLDAGLDYSHKIIKKEFKFLKRCSFKYAYSNQELLKNGKIIYVKDTHDEIIPYICPNKIVSSNKECIYTKKEMKDKKINKEEIIKDLSNLPNYLVHELLSKYKDKPSFYKIIKKELISRGIYENKKYRIKKEIDLEEGDFDDKYQRRRKIKCKKS